MGNWKMSEYSVERLNNEIDKKIITIPKYQRGSVWKESQKQKLIDSMYKGFPFGSILLYEKGNEYQIIDGLQRSTTIIEYVKNPAAFFVDENIDNAIIEKIVKLIGVNSQENIIKTKLVEMIKKWVYNEHKSMQDIQRMQYSDMVEEIIKELPTAEQNKEKIKDEIKNIFADFQNQCSNIANMQIPALIYQGDASLLPEIFERINSQGAKLTKYQIYSATWAHDIVKIKDNIFEDIILNNRIRYENMLDDSMELEDYDSVEFNRKKEINIFELVFGFGKMISKKYPYLFNYDEKEKTKVESVGFNLINSCLGQKSSNMKNLNTSLKKIVGLDTENTELFLKKILEAIEYVDKRLGAGIKFKCNSRTNSKINPLHTELQIISIIASIFIARHINYKLNDNGDIIDIALDMNIYNKSWSQMKERFNENIMKIYTMDILGQKWRGSGDKKLDTIITENYYYNRVISWKEFEQVLDVYHSTLISERNERKQVSNPKESEKLILSLIYSKIFTAQDQNDYSNYDIEHLATKNLMKSKIMKFSSNFKLPISSIANLCLLPEYDNRMKKDKTIYQDEFYLSKFYKGITDLEEKYTFTIKSDFAWLEDELTEDQFRDAYLKFLNDRYEKMKKKIFNTLFEEKDKYYDRGNL